MQAKLIAVGMVACVAAMASVRAMPQQPAAPAATAARPAAAAPGAPSRALVDTYCVGCHNARVKVGGLALDGVDLAQPGEHAEVWEKAIRKLRGGLMPPAGSRRPAAADVEAFVTSLERALDAAAEAHPEPGRVPLHRLNRAEYANAIEELLGVRVDAAALLPKDDEADGFDNVASVLTVSPSFLDQYISAARTVTLQALGAPAPRPGSVTYRPAPDQSARVEGLPLGTRGGLLVDHVFPADGDYTLHIGGLAIAGYVRGMEYRHTLIVTIDGRKVFENQLGGEDDIRAIDQQQASAVAAINGRFQNIPLKVAAGPHKVGVAFIGRTFAESDDVLHAFRPGAGEDRVPRIGNVEIRGPFTPTGMSNTPSRQRVLICQPATAAEETACATRILSSLARRAFRRPVTAADLDPPMAFYKQGRGEGDFEAGIRAALPAILASPKFLYRAERAPAGTAAGTVHRVTGLDLASRLSFFVTARPPDDELLKLAEEGRLGQSSTVEAQTRRLLAGPRSESLVTQFAAQWLKLRALDDIDPDANLFPNFDAALREAFEREIELFVGAVFREDRSVLDLLSADFTYVNERLALHYGLPGVRGERFRRVTLADNVRWGLLGKGGVLMATSYANRTAPVIRGAWILENIIGAPPAAPPPDVEGFPENKDGEKALTVREIMEKHRRNPSCASCHAVMDPLGLALENFDAIGEWRDKDRQALEAIDASGRLVDGTPVNGPEDLRRALLRRPEQFVQTLTERLMTYALGRSVEAHDMPAVRKIVRDAARDDYRFSALVLGIVRSAPFQMRKAG